MYKLKTQTRTFDTTIDNDMRDYSAIMDNRLCSITNELEEKLEESNFDDEGHLLSKHDRIVKVVTWTEKVLF